MYRKTKNCETFSKGGRRQRLEYARKLLTDEPGTKINRIARRAGYTSANQLAKAFDRQFGESPRDFRKSTQ